MTGITKDELMHVSIESCNTFNSGVMKAARYIRALKINTGD